jgi:hypothetical protein
MVELKPLALLPRPPPMVAKSPVSGMLLFLPPLTVEKSPLEVLSVPWLTAPMTCETATPVVISRATSTIEVVTSNFGAFIIIPLQLIPGFTGPAINMAQVESLFLLS